MKKESFNLIEEKWIPIAGRGRASLREIFADGNVKGLGGNARQKIALMKLLLGIAQAACTPESTDEWRKLGPVEMATACLKYLEKWHDKFYLYGDEPFLQMPVERAKIERMSIFQPEIAQGNNPRLTHIQCAREMEDADRALMLLTEMSMCLGGKKGDRSVSLAAGYEKRSAPGGPGVGHMGYLHSFLTGSSILETLWLNLLTKEEIANLPVFSAGLGVPPWERMPKTENCEVAQELRNSLQGRLIPMARFCKLSETGVHYTEGISHPGHLEGRWDPSVAGMLDKKKYTMVWTDPEKRPWRSLSALLAFLSAQKGLFQCAQLGICIPRLKTTDIDIFGIWSGGLRVSSNAGEQFVSGSDDMVESETMLNRQIFDEEWYDRFAQTMNWLEDSARVLFGCVMKYYDELGAEAKGEAARATGIFWELAERELLNLINACADRDSTEDMKKIFRGMVRDAYDDVCPHETARQLLAWAGHRPGNLTGKKKRETAAADGK